MDIKLCPYFTDPLSMLEYFSNPEEIAHSFRVLAISKEITRHLERRKNSLSGTQPTLLQAALLHDIGHCMDKGKHDRNSEYLIRSYYRPKDISPKTVLKIAAVAGSHRKRISNNMEKFSAKSIRDLMALASILRLADGIDYLFTYGHCTLTDIELTKKHLCLCFNREKIKGKQIKRLKSKANLFLKIFKLKLKIKAGN